MNRSFDLIVVACGSLALLAGTSPAQSAATVDRPATIQVDAGYPGGNIVVEKIAGGQVILAPDQRDTVAGQWWFYWNFGLKAPPDQAVTMIFRERNPIGVRGPAVSIDGGTTWKWLGAVAVKSIRHEDKPAWSFEAMVPAGAAEARYSFCPPYLESHLQAWLAKHRNHPALKVGELCRSRKGRPVEMLRAGCLDPTRSKGVILLTSRHHCCETMATYAMEGILESALADDETGRNFRDRWEIVAVPFMDKDGVEDGDQGKFRRPHDHNRDYNDEPLYPEIAALIKLGASLGQRVAVMLDLHCPYIRGQWNDRVYLVGPPEPDFAAKQKAFARVLAQVQQGPIKFRAEDCLDFGTAWNTNNNFKQGRSSSAWARAAFPQARLVGTMEIAYADALGVEVNAESARALGRDLARALAEYLR